jgi:galactonate dehydratase
MKITKIETFQVPPRWLFLRMETDEGVVGWGEPIVEGRAESVAAAVAEMSDYLIGEDASRIEDHWQVLTKGGFYRGGPVFSSAVAGIDQALWDIKGKALDVPVYELLGGAVRDKVRMYTWIHGGSPQELADSTRMAMAAGFNAVKFCPASKVTQLDTAASIRGMVSNLAAVREAGGDELDIALDFHGRFSPAMSRRVLPLMEEYLPMFVEEVVVPELSADLGFIAQATSIPLATGERLYSRWDFRAVLGQGVSVVQPDLSHAGGISEVRRIAAMAETYGALLAPHCPLGPIALAASLQVDVASPNFLIQEQSRGAEYTDGPDLFDYLAEPDVFDMGTGYIARPMAPGLGIQIDEEKVRSVAQSPHHWRNAIWRQNDNSFLEW